MGTPAFDIELSDYIIAHTVRFKLCPRNWELFSLASSIPNISEWNEVKFLGIDSELHSEMDSIPADVGGIYLFIIKANVLDNTSDYLVYIGRAQLTDSVNLKKRCRHYLSEYKSDDPRPKIKSMISKWGDHLYIRYFTLADNDLIISLEKELINVLLPPFCDEIPDIKLKRATAALT